MTRFTRFGMALAGGFVACGLVACGGGGGGSSNWSPDADILDDSTSGAMVSIPAGEAKVGVKYKKIKLDRKKKSKGRYRSKQMDGFQIDKYEVTNGNYYKFLETLDDETKTKFRPRHHIKTAKHPGWYSKSARYKKGKGNHPVSGIPFKAAQAYAKWRGKRLPKEFEWEYAARGKEGFCFVGSDTYKPGSYNTGEGGPGKPVAVDSEENAKDKSPFGVIGMGGNVSEYVATDETRKFNVADEEGNIIKGERKTFKLPGFRGPNFESMRDTECLLSYQGYLNPVSKKRSDRYNVTIGFRCAK